MRLLAGLLLLASLVAPAQTTAKTPAHKPAPAQLKFVLIVSRHGVRPPLVEKKTLDQYAAEPWPAWEVPLGELTPHGAIAIQQMGQYMRLRYAEDGLFPPGGCPAPSEIFLYADIDHRNIDSTRATFAGFAPNCDHLDINMMAPTPKPSHDPLFSAVPYTFAPPPDAASEAALRADMRINPDIALTARGNPELSEMARILAPDPAHQPEKPILKQPISFSPGTWGVTAHGPLPAASNLIEDLELEFIDAKPLAQVGWGRLGTTDDEANATLLRLLPLHVKAFDLGLRTPLYAKAQGSNILAHLLATLNQAADAAGSPSMQTLASPTFIGSHQITPIGPAGAKLVYLSAHDSNLFTLGGLLGLHWRADSRSDDTPPDSHLAFELWQRPGSTTYNVRIFYRAQTLMQLRSAEALSLENPPAEVELTPTGCVAHRPCPLATFLGAATHTIDPAFVVPNLVPLTLAP